MLKIAFATVAFVAQSLAFAQATPVGLWKTIDDDGKTEKSLVRISETAGVLTGKIEKILDPSAKPNAVCDECKDERAGKPLVGLTILRNLKKGDEEWYEGGDVTDPKNGKVYRAKVRTLEGGKQLQMRGYIGPFYRTQTWIRVE